MRYLLGVLLLFFFLQKTQAQIDPNNPEAIQDSLQEFGKREVANDSLKVHTPVISDYKYWRQGDISPTVVDTALTVESFYRQNFTHKDVFAKMYFPNFGQTFNPLEYEESRNRIHLLPTGKSFNYLFPEDVRYYDVKTPTTEFLFENGLREGQYLSTTFTHNLTPQLNYSVRYRGLRSMGRYQNNLAANNAFIATISYKSKNERFKLWTHFASQNLDNEENGGIQHLEEFVLDDSLRTTNRQNIAVNLESADTQYDSRRFHLGASYGLFGKAKSDSTNLGAPILIKNIFTYEKQKYFYEETAVEDYYESPVFSGLERRNRKNFETLQNTSTVEFKWGERLLLEAGVRIENLKLYSSHPLSSGLINVPREIKDNLLGGVAKLYFDWNERVKLIADAEFKSGEIFKSQYHVSGELDIQPIEGYHIVGGILAESAFPSLNLFYNQSFYKDFNYYNYSFDNINTQKLFGKLNLEKLKTDVEASLYNVENYVYVGTDFRPRQLDGNISLFQIKANNLISYRKFHLRTTAQYQKVTQNEGFLPLPDVIARASIYWQSKMFNDRAEVQIGFNANYFSEFESREFFPVINEFMLQRTHPDYGIQKIGGNPMLDFFLNIKVDRMRIYLRADHFNTFWGENNYYSVPYTPFRDFKIQFGVKWYLFT
ncbi:putative porin [Moheibacter sp.]|uniref:putative porin n=1 Tax=Moheibacter sp. TaxID=1965316 RepID=UPI003C739AAA